MVDAAKFKPMYGRVLEWFYGVGRTPNDHERRVYELGANFHGFRTEGQDRDAFDATFLAVFVRAYLLGQEPLPPPGQWRPVFFFVPKVHEAWGVTRARLLAHEAISRQPNSRIPVIAAMKRMTAKVVPWQLEEAPRDWVAYGFSEKDEILLPDWCKSKLV